MTLTPHHWRRLAHVGALLPLVWLTWDWLQTGLGFDPIREATFFTGKTAIILMMLTLACTPISLLTGYKKILVLRKTLGLYTFFYAAFHFLIFIWLDYGLDWALIYEATFEKRYALVGFAAFAILLLLAATSYRQAQRQLGKWWKPLHRLVYLSGVLAVLHYIWLAKQDYTEPIIFTAILTFLLAVRLPPIQRRLKARHRRRARQAQAT